ncbi:MAG: hypothetical protein EXS59_01815 [Candidatus Taylorbacteria bacterium]|nr:hypothetical protein [Candidatus Taylorbacteria bacterium]
MFLIGIAAVVTLIGCGEGYQPPVYTFFPTNRWTVKSVVVGEVVVETEGTNLLEKFRVVKASPVLPLTNGQPARIELKLRRGAHFGLEFISARAYPAKE